MLQNFINFTDRLSEQNSNFVLCQFLYFSHSLLSNCFLVFAKSYLSVCTIFLLFFETNFVAALPLAVKTVKLNDK